MEGANDKKIWINDEQRVFVYNMKAALGFRLPVNMMISGTKNEYEQNKNEQTKCLKGVIDLAFFLHGMRSAMRSYSKNCVFGCVQYT